MNYFKDMTIQQIREELEDLDVVLTDAQFNALTYAELNDIGRKAHKVYKLNLRIGQTIAGAEGRLYPPLKSDNIPSVPNGEFR